METVSCPPELSVRVSVLVKVPYAVGWNVTEMVQVAPTAKTAGHLLLSVNDVSPLKAIFEIPTEAPLELVTVTV